MVDPDLSELLDDPRPRAQPTLTDTNILGRIVLDLLHALDMSTTNAERNTRLDAILSYYGDDIRRIARGRS